ncbi:MAG: SMC-Scp complex subunit ScpB [Chitinophagaceae bacterium]|nr:SMC-Scp complex subunit ScpB [Chitinophagaceae bacterium]
MGIADLVPHIEALIFASDKPLSTAEITELADNILEEKITAGQVENAIGAIVEKYNSGFYPFEVKMTGGGWQFLTKQEFHKTVALLNGDKFLKRLSAAALETLAIIAYKQPITKGEIEAIRGVNCDYTVQRLLEKELIVISGRNEHSPGQPLLYSTSRNFMDYFGINSPEELPKLKEINPEDAVEPTIIKTPPFETEQPSEDSATAELSVTEAGELISNSDNDSTEEN